jgi:probable rRNA maturation factor
MKAGTMVFVQRRVPAAGVPAAPSLRAWALAALEDATPGELTIRVVDEAESAELNGKFRQMPHPTNVLAFPYDAEALSEPVLGDLAICAPVVVREAAEQHKDPNAHWAHMVVHGVLHLLGYDHNTDGEAAQMEAKERQILERLGFPDPY